MLEKLLLQSTDKENVSSTAPPSSKRTVKHDITESDFLVSTEYPTEPQVCVTLMFSIS